MTERKCIPAVRAKCADREICDGTYTGGQCEVDNLNYIGPDAAAELKAYRDIGLTPEEINELLHQSYGRMHITLARAVELAKADEAGRVVTLRWTLGQEVWVLLGREKRIPTAMVLTSVKLRPGHPPSYKFSTKDGKTEVASRNDGSDGLSVFLTQEEAESHRAEMLEMDIMHALDAGRDASDAKARLAAMNRVHSGRTLDLP